MTPEEFIAKFPKQKDTYVNCMENHACPNCGSREELMVLMSGMASLTDDGTDANCGDHEYNGDSLTRCPACRHQGDLNDFTIDGLDDALDELEQVRTFGEGRKPA